MKKKTAIFISLLMSVLLITACSNTGDGNNNSGNTAKTNGTTSKKGYQTTGKTEDSDYQGVIRNGKYKTSKARGVGITQEADNMLNLQSFESGLTSLSKNQFSPKKYVFQEGQILSRSTVEDWLDRQSGDNPMGLNPKDNGEKDAKKRNPMYIQQIEEQDYMNDNDGKLSLGGITIGIGMNREDYYQKEQYGSTYTSKISKEEMTKQGRIAAAKVLARVRKEKGVSSDTPIMIALFEQAPNDSLVGGSFYASTVSKSGNEIGSWKDTNLSSYTFPATATKSVPNDNDETSFEGFQNKIKNFFPNLAGVTAQGQYKNKSLQGMKVNITTQFYSQTEITSFTQYVAQAARTYLPTGIPIDITVKGADGSVQSFLSRDDGSGDFYTHVFSSY
ncbi:CamS family sex pheromone protein [Ligilactobacillus pobuzihii]|uniref:CamS family sex pheromone protein n=1 Tax=Ligilactobacillus pobuzihii TaxID=449659 RepID=UPI0019CF7A15|nr:CamS family sex pheromone protein [Ligilactobacillus pobuzihii]MBN7274078.1 CamS family sex pheromone protein [Ligilactobacillus pobuzihii]HIZ95277.1 CamS family sex pheromone protein [Candidatus Ligilactobacillus excrementavium]